MELYLLAIILVAALVLGYALLRLARSLRRPSGVDRINFDAYKDQEIKKRGHYHKIVQ